jgi:hypothetical protein
LAPETTIHLGKDFPFTLLVWNRVQAWDEEDPRKHTHSFNNVSER